MKREEAIEITERSLKELNESLNSGKSEALSSYLKALAVFPQYSYRNIFLIIKQHPTATQIAGFRAWRKLGRWVKAGENGIGIIAPLAIRAKPEGDEDSVFGFRVVHVFDISQTEGEPLPDISQAKGNPTCALHALEKVFAKLGIYVESVDLPDGCLGGSHGGRVQIDNQLSTATRFQTLAHELAHELLHQKNDKNAERPSKNIRELEAEAVAYVVSIANGVECRDASCDYIQLYQGNEELLAASLERIRFTAVEILSLMDEEVSANANQEVNHAA